MSDNVIRSFGTILNDNRYVRTMSTKYKQVKKTYPKGEILPIELNPIIQWSNLLQSIKNQGACGCCFAMATSGALGDRLTIMTLGQFAVELSPYQMIMCQGAIVPEKEKDVENEKDYTDYIKEVNNQAHSSGGCNGNSLYSAMDFMYTIGLTTERCVNEGEFNQYNIKRLEDVKKSDEIPSCQDIIGKDYDTCLDMKTASSFYRIIAGYSIGSDIESIKQEIYKWGPVVSGFNVYSDFVDPSVYNGLTIYMGPDEHSSKLGGHAIKIMGWGSDDVNGEKVDYWWIANSWGTSWGLSGYFKMKMNIKECELEKNVVGFIPDLPGFKLSYLLYDIKLDPNDIFLRSWFNVNQQTGFRYNAIEKIREGKLKGNVDQPICRYIPDFKNMWVGKMGPEDVTTEYIKLAQYQDVNEWSFYTFFIIVVIVILSYQMGKFCQRFIKSNK